MEHRGSSLLLRDLNMTTAGGSKLSVVRVCEYGLSWSCGWHLLLSSADILFDA